MPNIVLDVINSRQNFKIAILFLAKNSRFHLTSNSLIYIAIITNMANLLTFKSSNILLHE